MSKPKKSLKRGKGVRVCWLDSSTLHGWTSKEARTRAGAIVSMGYVIDSNPTCLTLSTSIADNSDSMSPLSIPWQCIVKVEALPESFDRDKNLPI